MEAKAKVMSNDELLALSPVLGFVDKAFAEIVGRELHSRELVVPHGFKPSAVKQEKCDDRSGKPPS